IESKPIIVKIKKADTELTKSEGFVFPDENIRDTQKAEIVAPNFTNYSNETPVPRRPLRTNRSALVGAGLIAVLISVLLGTLLYNRMQHSAVSEQTMTVAPTTQTASDTLNDTSDTAENTLPDEPKTQNSAPNAIEKTPLTTSKRPDQMPSKKTTTTNESAQQNEPIQEQVAGEKPSATNGKPRTELNSALSSLISATNSRDVNQQMNYYAPKLNAYYLTRNASQDAVRAEKNRIFSRAEAVDIQTGKPDITLSPDGQKATMRFRKKYDIKQGQQSRSGEVIQELQWVKSDDGWRIVSERDVKVINR
ncbi:MAG: nuclear transport factor 2 family protein, partial [Acidobacteriota bacterium]